MPKAVVLTSYGPPDVLVWRDVPLPEPGPGQVRIRVKAAGVSPTDAKIRHGDVQAVFRLPPNAVLGFDAAGGGARHRARLPLPSVGGNSPGGGPGPVAARPPRAEQASG